MTKARQKSSPKQKKKSGASTRISRENIRGVQKKNGRSLPKKKGRLNDLVGRVGNGRRADGKGGLAGVRVGKGESTRNTFYYPNRSLRSPVTRSRSLAARREIGKGKGEVIVISDDEEDEDEDYEEEDEEEEKEEEEEDDDKDDEVLIIEEREKSSIGRPARSAFSWDSDDLSPPPRYKSPITKHPRPRVPSIAEDLSSYIRRQTPLKLQPSLLSISSISPSSSPPTRRKPKPPIPTLSPSLSPSPPPRRPSFSHQPSYISLSLPSKPPDYYIQAHHLRFIVPGTVVWLPLKIDMLPNAYVDPGLHVNAFDHPAVVLSVPPGRLGLESRVEIAIMTTCQSRTLHETKQLSHRSRLLRVRTRALPSAKVDLTFKGGAGMKSKYSYVNCTEGWEVQVGSLGFYGRGRSAGGKKGKGKGKEEELEWLVLTAGSLEKLRGRVEEGRRKGKGTGKGVGKGKGGKMVEVRKKAG
ncbi:hypothetical protein CJF32_00008797 [Rutstroemia sp. NJR-2017a WRK4]|nr:hypothetical protein CJF32_00008797 [Rutstroemia sp. NJR-2017a WRK4]